MIDFYRLKTRLDGNGIFLSYSGAISQALLDDLGEILQKRMGLCEDRKSTIITVFKTLVELSQDSTLQTTPPPKKHPEGTRKLTLAAGFELGHYYIMGGYRIKNSQLCQVHNKLKPRMENAQEKLDSYQWHTSQPQNAKTAAPSPNVPVRTTGISMESDVLKIDKTHSFLTLKAVL